MTLVYDNIEVIETTFVNDINYEETEGDTYYNYFICIFSCASR